MSDDKSIDLLGIKGFGDSVRISVERLWDGAAAFLSRVCLPVAEELGLAWRDRVSAWRANNAARMLAAAEVIHKANVSTDGQRIHPRLVHKAIEEASWTDDDELQRMWAGLLVSGASSDGKSDENLIFMTILGQLSSLQVRVLQYSVTSAEKYAGEHGLPYAEEIRVPTETLNELFPNHDIHRLDRELDHLREIGLITGGRLGLGGGINMEMGQAGLTPTALALNLYVRAQGAMMTPVAYWHLRPREADVQPSGTGESQA